MHGLDGIQSALNAQGPQALAIADVAWLLFIGGGALFVGILAVTWLAFIGPVRWRERIASRRWIVGGGIALPLLVLTPLLVYALDRAAAFTSADPPALRIEVTGKQWWWHVRYLHADGSEDVVTANEIRIPAAAPVDLLLRSGDVIHSFWVPALAGKLDMIPGRTNRLRVHAAQPGVWRGQCAEFCGGPHAWMGLRVIALPSEDFGDWLQSQRQPAAVPESIASKQGERLFREACAACHTIRGTSARGVLGPDLTHIASRRELGAGRMGNDADALAAWIASGQHLKPDNLMPAFGHLAAADLRALVDYLVGLR